VFTHPTDPVCIILHMDFFPVSGEQDPLGLALLACRL
jgi:hypothetical protein